MGNRKVTPFDIDEFVRELTSMLEWTVVEISPDTRIFIDLGLDSISLAELFVTIEELAGSGAQVNFVDIVDLAEETTLRDLYGCYLEMCQRPVVTIHEREDNNVANLAEPVAIAAPLSGRTIRLRPILPEDHRALYALATREETAFRWRFMGRVPGFNDFVSRLEDQVLT